MRPRDTRSHCVEMKDSVSVCHRHVIAMNRVNAHGFPTEVSDAVVKQVEKGDDQVFDLFNTSFNDKRDELLQFLAFAKQIFAHLIGINDSDLEGVTLGEFERIGPSDAIQSQFPNR